jgi:hypothetical protein
MLGPILTLATTTNGLLLILDIKSTERRLWRMCTGRCSGQITMPMRGASIKISHVFVVNAALHVDLIVQMGHARLKSSERGLSLDSHRLLVLGGEPGHGPLKETQHTSVALELNKGIAIEVEDITAGASCADRNKAVKVALEGVDQRGARSGQNIRERRFRIAYGHQLVKQCVNITNLAGQNRGGMSVLRKHRWEMRHRSLKLDSERRKLRSSGPGSWW